METPDVTVTMLDATPAQADPGRVTEANPTRPDPEVPERAHWRTFTARYKLDVLAAYDAADPGEKGAILRRITVTPPASGDAAEQRLTVGVEHHGRLVPLGPAVRRWLETGGGASSQLLASVDDVLLFLGGAALRAETDRVLDAVGDEDFGAVQACPGLPFAPVSFRDCALWEQYMIDATRGRRSAGGAPLVSAGRRLRAH
jgi:hypothetical protein